MAAEQKQKAAGKAQTQVDQTMQKASDQSGAAMGKVDRKVDSLLGK